MAAKSDAVLPVEIVDSWRRSEAAGLRRSSAIDPTPRRDHTSRKLALAAQPVLETFEREIADSALGLVLADRYCNVVDIRLGLKTEMGRAVTGLGLEVGAEFSEETSGTNAIATPAETGRGIFIEREQHYLACLHPYTCYGLPIFHPITGQLTGVVDLMTTDSSFSPLMKPALRQLVSDIQAQLLAMAGNREHLMLDAFLATCASQRHGVVAIGDDLSMSNKAARGLLDQSDFDRLRDFARDGLREGSTYHFTSGSGTPLEMQVAGAGSDIATICTLKRQSGPQRAVLRSNNVVLTAGELQQRRIQALRQARGHVLIAGPPGSGRTRAATLIAGEGPRFHPIDTPDGQKCLAECLCHDATAVVEDIHLLDHDGLAFLAEMMGHESGRLILTADLGSTDQVTAAQLDLLPAERLSLAPLRDRVGEIAGLVQEMAAAEGDPSSRFTSAALQVLREHPWHANLRELRSVVQASVARRSTGDIDAGDLPATVRASRLRRHNLGPLEHAEAEAILLTLRRTGGNKAHAAQLLQVSRSTLYQKLRIYGIDAEHWQDDAD